MEIKEYEAINKYLRYRKIKKVKVYLYSIEIYLDNNIKISFGNSDPLVDVNVTGKDVKFWDDISDTIHLI